ncbi:MAG: HlyD family efflux transporter periplasmic adaptor subunit, partial [Treponema sp.]|nr:HlyD family efflux transporter periplasmic adaptor subunit [Clostridia bacterium]MCF0241345.1 HlyD family efflux transporter periplasmic adaptor subunit [Treponema sp.]
EKYTFESWLETQKIQLRENIAANNEKLQNCQIEIMKIEQIISQSQVYSPVSGYISEIKKIQVGDFLYDGTEILNIVPDIDSLNCVAYVPASKISKITIGQEVIVQIDDLPWTKYGKLIGTVGLIPPDAIQSTDISYEKNFPVIVNLSQNFLQDRKKKKVYLHVGTSTKVKIKVSQNTIFEKFLQSLVSND